MIDFLPDADQQALINSVADFLAHEMPVERLRPPPGSIASPHSDHWNQFAELGWFGIGVAEEASGLGLTLAEETLVARELGRHLISPAVLAAMLAARCTEKSTPALAHAIVAGNKRVGLICAPDHSTQTHHLIDGLQADLLLLITADELVLFEPSAFKEREPVPAFDGALALERAVLSGAPLLRSSDLDLRLTARALIAAMLVGIAEAALQLGVEYVKLREQFGQPLAKFQAIKHICADLAVRAEAAWCQTVLAALSVRGKLPAAEFEIAAAEIVSLSSAVEITEQCIQLHGGIGFTAACDAHHYVKRARLLERLLGGIGSAQTRLLATSVPQ